MTVLCGQHMHHSSQFHRKLTVVTLSKEPLQKIERLAGVVFLNHVSVIASLEELHEERMKSFMKVQTSHCIKIDDTDTLISYKLPTSNIGIVTGIEILEKENKTHELLSCINWNKTEHILSPRYIHNGIINTQCVQNIIPLLPKGLYYTEMLIYYFLALCYGQELCAILRYTWNRNTSGFSKHPLIGKAMTNSMQWIANNEEKIKKELSVQIF